MWKKWEEKPPAVLVLASYSRAEPVNKGDDVTLRHGDALVLGSHAGRLGGGGWVVKITDPAKGRGKVFRWTGEIQTKHKQNIFFHVVFAQFNEYILE